MLLNINCTGFQNTLKLDSEFFKALKPSPHSSYLRQKYTSLKMFRNKKPLPLTLITHFPLRTQPIFSKDPRSWI